LLGLKRRRRISRTIKEATLKRYHYNSDDRLQARLQILWIACNLALDIAFVLFSRDRRNPDAMLQSGVPLHGFVNHLTRLVACGQPYTTFGDQHKQVRDKIHWLHSHDLCRLIGAFY